MFDLVIAGGHVIDGSGRKRYRADIGVNQGRVAAISRGEDLSGVRRVDASGKIVAPGFIDIHSHAEEVLFSEEQDELLAPLLLQGITTFLGGNCGESPAPTSELPGALLSMGRYLEELESHGVPMNVALLTGHGNLRRATAGSGPEPPGKRDLARMQALLRESLEEGSFGFSIGMNYVPGIYAEYPEMLALVHTTAKCGGFYAAHNRTCRLVLGDEPVAPGEPPANVAAVHEQLDLARDSGVRLQIAHLIFVGRNTWETCDRVLDDLDSARQEGIDVAIDAYPYTGGNTTIKVNFPGWFLADLEGNIRNDRAVARMRAEVETHFELIGRAWSDICLMSSSTSDPGLIRFEGMNFSVIGEELGMDSFDAYMHLARGSQCRATIMQWGLSGDEQDETPLRKVLSDPCCAFMLDAVLDKTGQQNPGAYGGFPRILGRYSRDLGCFTLEEAVRRMTGFSAERLGLKDVGLIDEGRWADITVFDPDVVIDSATPTWAGVGCEGISDVFVSGTQVVSGGFLTAGAGRRGRVMSKA